MKTFTSALKGKKLTVAFEAFVKANPTEIVQLDDDIWEKLFAPVLYHLNHPDGDGPRRYDHQISKADHKIWRDPAKAKYIWTEVDVDDGGTVLLAGKHMVNYLSFFLCNVPVDTNQIEVKWGSSDAEIEAESNDNPNEEWLAGQLEAEHGDSSHAIYGLDDWKNAVAMDETKKGYWLWVAEHIQNAEDEAS